MNCEKLHNALALKDQEIKERKENTIRCFEIVKAWALDKVVEGTIKNEFKSSVCLYEGEVYGYLLKEIGVDVSNLHYDISWSLYSRDKANINYTGYYIGKMFLGIDEKNEEYRKHIIESRSKEIEQYENLDKFKQRFDCSLFWNLIDNHILRHGFKTEVIKNIWGQRVVRNGCYITTRSKLEKACCPAGKKESPQYRVDGEPNMTAQYIFAISIIVVIFAIAALFIFGGLK